MSCNSIEVGVTGDQRVANRTIVSAAGRVTNKTINRLEVKA